MKEIIFIISLFIVGCGKMGMHKAIVLPSNDNNNYKQGTYAEVKPIFALRCGACHSSNMKPDWQDESTAIMYAKNGKLKARVFDGIPSFMPPSWSQQSKEITQADKDMLLVFINSNK